MIDKNIAQPEKAYGKKSETLAMMEIGDSIFDEGVESVSPSTSKWYAAAQQFGLKTGAKFSGRKVEGGIRIWRIS